VITPWVRNPTWLLMPPTTAAMEQVDLLVAVYPESAYFAVSSNVSNLTTYTVDWGDGTAPQNYTGGGIASYLYDYNNPALANTNGPVTFTDSTDTVNRTAHGYTNGMKISFAEIATTTGIVQLQTYYVVNATSDTFQLSDTSGGSVLLLTNDGTGAILPYKQAMVKITPTTVGATLSVVNLPVKNSTANLSAYSQPILDLTISANCPNLLIGSTVASNCIPKLMERCRILRHNTTTFANLFANCTSLQSISLSSTTNITNTTSMFYNCVSLREVPLFDTQNVTIMGGTNVVAGMFSTCTSLRTVPLFDTRKVTNMGAMFSGCNFLEEVPLFDTSSVTVMGTGTVSCGMFSNCPSLRKVPLFNTSNVTSMQEMFKGCQSLIEVPFFDTTKVTSMATMFGSCNSIITVPFFNTSSVTAMNSMFSTCNSLSSVPLFNTSNITTMNGMFQSCTALQTVPFFDTSKVTTFSTMFFGCINIGSIPPFDTSAATGTAAFTNMFNNCSSLQQIPDMNFNRAAITTSASYNTMFSGCNSLSKINLSPGNGPKFTFSVASCKLSAASLNQLYTSLPTVTGQTITVTGNVGIAADDPSIATLKNWVVTGS
jgi:surface protein